MTIYIKKQHITFLLSSTRSRWSFSSRSCCSHVPTPGQKSSNVRVRFAPSPTGYLHMGGLRTVVYNYLFAKANAGQFILRIEDTDRKRIVDDSVDNLIETLKWLGLEPDEGAGGYGGTYGPYYQSQRLELYQEHAEKLIRDGFAYRCFCSEDRLMMLRNEALKNRQLVKYDSRCRHLTTSETTAKLEQGHRYVIRFKLEPQKSSFNDLVYGEYEYDFQKSEGDFVIVKSDGYPTYHFANVLDDHLMRISHVMRGEEWLISTPKHLALYRASGWTPPRFAHLPLMLGLKGLKLSKRQKDVFVKHFQQTGYYALPLINAVCSSGRGFRNKDKEKLYSLDELIGLFDVDLISRQATRFEPTWLDHYNKTFMAQCSDQFLVQHLKSMIRSKYQLKEDSNYSSSPFSNVLNDDYVSRCIKKEKYRLVTLADMLDNKDLESLWTIPDPQLTCFRRRAGSNLLRATNILKIVLRTLEEETSDCAFLQADVGRCLKALSQLHGWDFPETMRYLRTAICGVDVGLPVSELFELLGRQTVCQRLTYVLRKVEHDNCTTAEPEKMPDSDKKADAAL